MFFLDDTLVTSASDLTNASHCEFAFLRALDAKLGRIEAVDPTPDAMLERAARLGDAHELRVLDEYRATKSVVEIDRPRPLTLASLTEAAEETRAAFAAGTDVVFQATFFDGSFVGFADFIVRNDDGTYEVQDTKLARSAKVTALLQLAAYGEQLQRIGVDPGERVRLILGDRSESEHRLRDILPVYRNRRQRLQRIIAERVADTAFVQWGDARYTACGRCDTCEPEIQRHRDLLLVANLRQSQRARLLEAGITTIDELAASTGPVSGLSDAAAGALRAQARLQVAPVVDGAPPALELYYAPALAALPYPDAGDIFFDFEGDPLYSEGEGREWGIDYLFGLIEADETFVPFWAHSHAEERQALVDFLDYVDRRRQLHPGMHIYHYAPYERTHLLSLAARHSVGVEQVDTLLRENVLLDLYPLVRKSIRVGSRSYSLKKLEPLYMASEREGVTNAGDSVDEYARSRVLLASGDVEASQRMLDAIAEYNEYDCVSTLRLRDWLLGLAASAGVVSTGSTTDLALDFGDAPPLHGELLALAGDPLGERSDDSIALALAAAAIDYHRRENKSFWWDHYARLVQPIDEWADTRDVFIVDRVEVERDWYMEGRQRSERRMLRLHGSFAPGSAAKVGSTPFALYEYPAPFQLPGAEAGARGYRVTRIIESFADEVLIEETRPQGVAQWLDFPSALTPAAPPPAGSQVDAIAWWGQSIVDAAPAWPVDAVLDILRRVPPRTRSGALSAEVVDSLLDLDNSWLAVQGPPGTGKTYLASHTITSLVRDHGWKIGVVAQSHAVVENVLTKVVEAGLPAAQVGKVAESGNFTLLRPDGHSAFAAQHPEGFVIGGTAWDFSKATRVPKRSLDLLVIDEAGQFSLGYTIAASVCARNLLLLGDPQQLPQVSQGTHPEPIDQSALGWISRGHDVLPDDLGFFLAESRRMHSAVTAPVSELSYEGKLRAHPSTSLRSLSGVAPGLHAVPVDHYDNSTSSVEEAAAVIGVVRDSLGKRWLDGAARPLEQGDFIVVSPYNAQVGVVREALDAAGFPDVRVGTVDKFQGQEAVIAIVTLAASNPDSIPRGMSFLLLKNRLNVAISRAQWAAYLVYSPMLTDYLPTSAAGLAELSAFITLTDQEYSSA